MKQSLLVELNTEELPPKALKSLSEAFASGLAKGLRDRQFLSDDSVVTAFGAPRRLAVHITHVLNRSPDKPFRQKLMPLAVARDAASNSVNCPSRTDGSLASKLYLLCSTSFWWNTSP